jgi:hypothetical protein
MARKHFVSVNYLRKFLFENKLWINLNIFINEWVTVDDQATFWWDSVDGVQHAKLGFNMDSPFKQQYEVDTLFHLGIDI